jgi:hypothetical protein
LSNAKYGRAPSDADRLANEPLAFIATLLNQPCAAEAGTRPTLAWYLEGQVANDAYANVAATQVRRRFGSDVTRAGGEHRRSIEPHASEFATALTLRC